MAIVAAWSCEDARVRQRGRRQAARHVADQRDPVRAEVEERRGEQTADHQHERARDLRRGEAQPEDHRQRSGPDQQRRRVRVAQRSDPRSELAPGVVAVVLGAGELRQLTDHDVDRRPGEEPRDHRLGEKARDPAELQQRHQQEQRAGHERDRGDQLGRLAPTEPGGEHGSAGDGREPGARPGRDLPRRAEERVEQRPGRGRVEPVLQRDAGDPRVAEVLRDDQRRHRHPGDQIAAQRLTRIARQPAQDRQPSRRRTHRRDPSSARAGCIIRTG